MQKLNPEEIDKYSDPIDGEFIPAVENAEYYFALVSIRGKKFYVFSMIQTDGGPLLMMR